ALPAGAGKRRSRAHGCHTQIALIFAEDARHRGWFPLQEFRCGGIMSALSELDRSKVVDIDLGSSEFKQNARDILADWAKRPPFYVLSSGPAQVICGRYADVHEIFSDTERFSSELPRGHGFEQFDKFMGVQFITQMDGERHARTGRLFLPAFSAPR